VLVEFLPMMLRCLSPGEMAIEPTTPPSSRESHSNGRRPDGYSLEDELKELQGENTELRETIEQLRFDLKQHEGGTQSRTH
jgi:hypothetical protein